MPKMHLLLRALAVKEDLTWATSKSISLPPEDFEYSIVETDVLLVVFFGDVGGESKTLS